MGTVLDQDDQEKLGYYSSCDLRTLIAHHTFWISFSSQIGTEYSDGLKSLCMVEGDTSVVMVGDTHGGFSGLSNGDSDFVAIKLDAATGAEIWRYQV